MSKTLCVYKEYARLRNKGWHAAEALRAARTTALFSELAKRNLVWLAACEDGADWSYDELFGDSYKPEANPDITPERLARQKNDEIQRIDTEGIYRIEVGLGEAVEEEDQYLDSVGGFIGDDWKDSGYDTDMMRACIRQLVTTTADMDTRETGWVAFHAVNDEHTLLRLYELLQGVPRERLQKLYKRLFCVHSDAASNGMLFALHTGNEWRLEWTSISGGINGALLAACITSELERRDAQQDNQAI